ncbi:MAG: TetR/AcrR family transcriptional regulator [Mycobacteriaceae bacterium]|nr:TetR/AcrR family transcriptional regulator [Mycobacteriaceae bacterium]
MTPRTSATAMALCESHKRGATKRRMLASAAEVLRERGAAGVTIDEVLNRSGAPRGSVYHHFPGGRNQILVEALQFAGDSMSIAIGDAASQGPMALLHEFVDLWEDVLQESDFAAGCPVVAAAISTSDEDPRLSTDAAQIFDRWRAALTRSFTADGFGPGDATGLATTMLAAIEGAVILCRSLRSPAPLREVAENIEFLVNGKKFVSRYGRPVAPQEA